MPIKKLTPIRAADGVQKPQKPELPAEPEKPTEPTKPAEPAKPAEPEKPAEVSAAVNWDTVLQDTAEPSDDEETVLSFLKYYLSLFPEPTPDQLKGLAESVQAPYDDLVKAIEVAKTYLIEIETQETIVEAPVSSSAFSAPIPGTSPPTGPEVDDFLLPMSTMEIASEDSEVDGDLGIDDGAPVSEEHDDAEQDALNNDNAPDLDDATTQLNNRPLNDDGIL